MTRTLFVVSIATALWAAASWSAEPNFLTDESAIQYLDRVVRAQNEIIPVGELSVVNAATASNYKNRTIGQYQYNVVRAAEQLGLVTIVHNEEFKRFKKGETFSWDDFDTAMKDGVTDQIGVSLTPEGEKLTTPDSVTGWRWVLLVNNATVQLISREKKSDGIQHFQLLMARYTAEWAPIVQQYTSLTSQPHREKERKTAILLKMDPFTYQWKIAAREDKGMSEELDMSTIQKALGNAR